jgi:endonuclease/exonuclease/phosphatase (EEP) superfamily protein YafD
MTTGIRLMTTNLLHGGAEVDSLREALDVHEPDVVVTQELGFDCADLLADRFPYSYLHPSEEFKGRGIATRLGAEFGDIPMHGRWGTLARLDAGGVTWQLAGIHLLNPIEFPWWRSVGGRTSQLDAVDGWTQGVGGGPAVLAGDFNATPRWPAYRRLVESGWTDLVAELEKDDALATWAWRPGWPRMLRIDHVFGRGISAKEVVVVPIAGSDHAAVVVDLEAV